MSDFEKMDEWDIDRGIPKRSPNRNSNRNTSRLSRDYQMGERYSSPRTTPARKRKKKKKRILKVLLAFFLSVLLVGLIMCAVYIIMQHLPGKSSKKQVYHRSVNVADCLSGDIAIWLSTIEDVEIDSAYVSKKLGNIKVDSVLTMDTDSDGNNTYQEMIDDKSYEDMTNKVNKIVEEILSSAIAKSLEESGYAEEVSNSEAEAIASSVLGMSISEYLQANNVLLIPAKDSLEKMLNMGSGTYNIKKKEIIFTTGEGETTSEQFMKKNGSLILIDSQRIYSTNKE